MKPPGQGPPAQTSTDRSQPTRHSHSILLGQCQGDDVYKAQGVSRGSASRTDTSPGRGDRIPVAQAPPQSLRGLRGSRIRKGTTTKFTNDTKPSHVLR